jgi:hypothetical protein
VCADVLVLSGEGHPPQSLLSALSRDGGGILLSACIHSSTLGVAACVGREEAEARRLAEEAELARLRALEEQRAAEEAAARAGGPHAFFLAPLSRSVLGFFLRLSVAFSRSGSCVVHVCAAIRVFPMPAVVFAAEEEARRRAEEAARLAAEAEARRLAEEQVRCVRCMR